MRLPVLALSAVLAALGARNACAASSLSVTAVYEARILIKVADLRTDQVVLANSFRAGARVGVIGALGVIKPTTLLVQSNGVAGVSGPAPGVYIQTEKNKRRLTRFAGGAGLRSLADPLTQLLRAVLQPGAGSPCIGTVPVYDGRQRYDLSLSSGGGGTLEGRQASFGLSRPSTCRLGFHPISGFSGGAPKKTPFMRGDPIATFAYAERGRVWVLTDIAVPTMVGTGHIALTSLRIDGTRPVVVGPARGAPPSPVRTRKPGRRRR